jgi:hypothetical protein
MLQECSAKPHQERMQIPFGIDGLINSAAKQLYFEFHTSEASSG